MRYEVTLKSSRVEQIEADVWDWGEKTLSFRRKADPSSPDVMVKVATFNVDCVESVLPLEESAAHAE